MPSTAVPTPARAHSGSPAAGPHAGHILVGTVVIVMNVALDLVAVSIPSPQVNRRRVLLNVCIAD